MSQFPLGTGSWRLPREQPGNTAGLSPAARAAFGCARLGAQGGRRRTERSEWHRESGAVPNITMRSPSFCIGPCPAQTFCICKNLALFPFSWAASSSLTAGLKETQNSSSECCAGRGARCERHSRGRDTAREEHARLSHSPVQLLKQLPDGHGRHDGDAVGQAVVLPAQCQHLCIAGGYRERGHYSAQGTDGAAQLRCQLLLQPGGGEGDLM